jgi:hypothetical protein
MYRADLGQQASTGTLAHNGQGARVEAIVAVGKPGSAIVSGRGGGIKPGACDAPLRGLGA